MVNFCYKLKMKSYFIASGNQLLDIWGTLKNVSIECESSYLIDRNLEFQTVVTLSTVRCGHLRQHTTVDVIQRVKPV